MAAKVGANWIHEPHLFATFNGGAADVNIPLDMYAFYAQDDWRVTDRLTLNLGLRYDYVDGVPIYQDPNANFQVMQQAGAAGRFVNTPLLEDFGQSPRNDGDNGQPRLGLAYEPPIRTTPSTSGRRRAPMRATACRSASSSRRRGTSRSRRSSSIARGCRR
jgi:outer membrane receptor protein involved in Fe transport